MLLQWELGQTIPVLFSLADKKRLIVSILHSATKYAGEFRVENHHAGEVVAFVGEHTERRDPMLALINSVNLKNPRKEKMVPKDDTEVWEYYEYLENYYKVLNPGSLTAEERNENFKLSPLTPTHIWTRIMVPGYVENMGRPLVTPDGSKRKFTKGTRQKILQPLLNLRRCAVIQTTRNQSIGQSDVEITMYPSSHMEKFLEDRMRNTLG